MQNLYTVPNDLKNLTSKKEIGAFLLKYLVDLLKPNYASFVCKEDDVLKVLSQVGDGSSGKEVFKNGVSKNIYDLVLRKGEITSLKFDSSGLFFFIPLLDKQKDFSCEHGLFVLNLSTTNPEINSELKEKIKFLCDVGSLALTRISNLENQNLNIEQAESSKKDLLLTKIHRAISGTNKNKKILFNVIEDSNALADGKVWWIDDLSSDITLILIAEVKCEGLSATLVNGYLIGLLNGLKAKADIALHPAQTLKYLNQELNQIFKEASLLVNAWYGVFNLDARKVRFANANHPEPYLIGPEQQVTKLLLDNNLSIPLGLNVKSEFQEGSVYISSGSKLVIFTKDLLDKVENIGQKYDPHWLPQILETVGALPLSEMRKSLDNILSESAPGTASRESRLALLLEIPAR